MQPRIKSARLCVLASGSGGNCSILEISEGGQTRLLLIDLGLSPRRIGLALRELELSPENVACALLTHPDGDHLRPLWFRRRTPPPPLFVGAAHAPTVRRIGALQLSILEDAKEPVAGVRLTAVRGPHDELGSYALRLDIGGCGSLGFATDLGSLPEQVIRVLSHVDVLAIESNHCPRMQLASTRPDALKRRVLGPRGHLSNQQCLDAIERIGPIDHVVLLHLSRECNHPDLVSRLHEGAHYSMTIAHQSAPTRWIHIGASLASRPRSLFDPIDATT